MTSAPSPVTAVPCPADSSAEPSTSEPVRRPHRISRRDLLRLAGTAALGAGLAACAPPLAGIGPGRAASQNAQLVYQDSSADWFAPMVAKQLELFMAQHPNIRVFYTPEPRNSADVESKTLAMMQAGTAPDVIMGCCTWFPIWAQKGYMLDLRRYVAADLDQATLAEWSPAQYGAFSIRSGLQFGLPKYHGALALYYNKDIFDAYGVGYPEAGWTYDDYFKAMRRLTHDRTKDGQTDLWGSMMWMSWIRYQVHINGWGGHIIDSEVDTKCRLAEPEALGALEWLRARTWDDHVMANKVRVNNMAPSAAFADERIAMAEDGSWALNDILSKAKFRIGVAPFPTAPVRKTTSATIDGYGIFARSKNPDAAWELVKYLVGADFGRALSQAGLLQPARASLVEAWTRDVRDHFPDQAADIDLAAFADGHTKGYSVVPENAANMADASRIMNAAMESLITWGDGTMETIKAAAREIDESQKKLGAAPDAVPSCGSCST